MKIMIRARSHGKTYELMRRWLEEPDKLYVVCHSAQRADQLANQAWEEMGRQPDGPDSWGRTRVRRHFYGISSVDRMSGLPVDIRLMFDDIDMCLSALCRGRTIELVTATATLA